MFGFLVSVGLAFALGAVLQTAGGVARALAEIYGSTTSRWPFVLTGVLAIAIAWLGVALYQAAATDGEQFVGSLLVGAGLFVAYLGGVVWRIVRIAPTIGDHEPRG